MARRPRIQVPDLIRHVMARGNGRMRIFRDDIDYHQFIVLLQKTVEECEIKCWNYCLMPNHYHLTVQPRLPNISAAFQYLNSTYARWWNERHSFVGHVFQGRFKDQVVDREEYALTLTRYVAMNPVRAGLVKRPEDWRWSSYRATAGLARVPGFLSARSTLDLFGDDTDAALRQRYSSFVFAQQDDAAYDVIRSNKRILGNQDFKAKVWGWAQEGLQFAPPKSAGR